MPVLRRGAERDPADHRRDPQAWVHGGQPPFPDDQLGEYVGVAVTFEYLNRMNNVFLPGSPIPARLPGLARDRVRRTIGGWSHQASGPSSLAARSGCSRTPSCPRTCHGRQGTRPSPPRSPARARLSTPPVRGRSQCECANWFICTCPRILLAAARVVAGWTMPSPSSLAVNRGYRETGVADRAGPLPSRCRCDRVRTAPGRRRRRTCRAHSVGEPGVCLTGGSPVCGGEPVIVPEARDGAT